VGPDYFRVIGTQLLAGRVIDERDQPNSRRVAVVNQTFVRQFLDGGNPLGRTFGFRSNPAHAGDFEIVGVVEDAKYWSPREAVDPMFFVPLGQNATADFDYDVSAQVRSNFLQDIAVRVTGDPGQAGNAVRQALTDAAPNLTVLRVSALEEQIGRTFNQERLIARLTAAFGLLALALASVGLYGVMAYNVARRTSEIGLRMALGAGRGRTARMILGDGFLQVAVGLALGIPGALATTRLIASNLYGLTTADPMTIASATAVLLASALIASYVPAHRASRVEPLVALRHE
jgi:predicted permease